MLYDFDIEYELFEEGPIDVIEYYVTAYDTDSWPHPAPQHWLSHA
jgi:hypothetical protein